MQLRTSDGSFEVLCQYKATLTNCAKYIRRKRQNTFPDVCCTHQFAYKGRNINLIVASLVTVMKPCLDFAFVKDDPLKETW